MRLVEQRREPTVRIPQPPEPNFPELADFPTDIPIHPVPKPAPKRSDEDNASPTHAGEEPQSNREWPPTAESSQNQGEPEAPAPESSGPQ
jgi:hypothetical protein